MRSTRIPSVLKKMNEIFASAGYKAYLVGGAVRDVLLGKEASDFDVATNATPRQVSALFSKVIPTGIAHGTVTVRLMGQQVEVTTFRTESSYSDGRHPDSVRYAATIEEDLSRRDFTMNAIAQDLSSGAIIDPFCGQEDIKKKLIRTVGCAKERFLEDGLRPIRAIRFSAQLGFSIEEKTFEAIADGEVQKKIRGISIERFRDEFCKMMAAPKPSQAIFNMERTGILSMFLPELAEGRGCEQKDSRGFHIFDVLDHNIYACDGAPQDNLTVRIAAIFHDVGKPEVRVVERNGDFIKISFHGHDESSARRARKILSRLRFSNSDVERISHLIECHMFYYRSDWTDAAVRRFVAKVGPENISDLIALRMSDMFGKYNQPVRIHDNAIGQGLIELQERARKQIERHAALSLKDLAVNGKDLMEAGIPQGRTMGWILGELLQMVIDAPELNTRERLLYSAQKLKERAMPEIPGNRN